MKKEKLEKLSLKSIIIANVNLTSAHTIKAGFATNDDETDGYNCTGYWTICC